MPVKKKTKKKESGWGTKVKPIPVDPRLKHPEIKNDNIPPHEFTWGMIAPKGAGKTTLMCNLLMMCKGFFHTIIVVSPSIESDEKWDFIKKQKLLVDNIPLKKWMKKQKQKESKSKVVEDAPKGFTELAMGGVIVKGTEEKEIFDPCIPEDCFYRTITHEQLKEIMNEQAAVIEMLKNNGESKYLANRILWLFDDMVGSSLFAGKKTSNPFLELNVRHRHFSSSLVICTQGYKEIPKTDRTGYTALAIFEIPNYKELEVIYEEHPNKMKRDQWQEMYEHATDGDHDFMYINYKKPKPLRMMKNFDKVLFFAEEPKKKVSMEQDLKDRNKKIKV